MSSIFDFIKAANKEYNKNGRSELFGKMERKMLSSKNAMQLYFFARYVKGVDITKFQNAVISTGDLEVGFYFIQYVPEAEIEPFLECAVQQGDKFWTEKYIEITEKAETRKIHTSDLRAQVIDRGINISPVSQIFKIDNIMQDAPKEFRKNGRSQKFIDMEREVIHSKGSANLSLFLSKYDNLLNVKSIERALILRGDPSIMYLFTQVLPSINKKTILLGLEMAKNDYIQQEQSQKLIQDKIMLVKAKLNVARKKGTTSVYKLQKELDTLESTLDYQDKIDVYIFEIKQQLARNR